MVAAENAFKAIAAPAAVLERSPADAPANAAVGKYRCFVKGDWSAGCRCCARGRCNAEGAGGTRPAKSRRSVCAIDHRRWLVGLGRSRSGWHPRPALARGRAAVWYDLAAPKLTGLAKAKAEERVAEAAAMAAEAGAGRPGRRTARRPPADGRCPARQGRRQLAVRDGALIVEKSDGGTRLEIPYRPPEEYDFAIDFTRVSGDADIMQSMVKANRPFLFCMGLGEGKEAGCLFGPIQGGGGGIGTKPNPSRTKANVQTGKRHRCVVKVRADRLEAYLDDRLVCQWKSDGTDMTKPNMYPLRDGTVLAVGSFKSGVTFHAISATEVKGLGKDMRAATGK